MAKNPRRPRSNRSAGAKKRGRRGADQAKRRRTGLFKPVEPDEALAQIVGREPQPRPELTRKVWQYIKARDLQDRSDRRVIRPDASLRRVFGDKSSVSMFEVGGALSAHVRSSGTEGRRRSR